MKMYNVVLVFIVGLMLSACGGGGGGAEPAAVTPPADTYTGLDAATGEEAGVASVDGVDDAAVYTYNFKGTPVDVTLNGLEADDFVNTTEDVIARHIGGTTYSYSRFGVVASYSAMTTEDHITDGEVFYVGQKTSSMPTTGTATYSGYLTTLLDGEFSDATITFNVDYGESTIGGAITDGYVFDTGAIVGSDFSGTVSANSFDVVGAYHGSFFGPNAEELGGVGTIDGAGVENFGFSFGAQKIN